MSFDHVDILIRLLIAHFLADFVLQPAEWVSSKKSMLLRSSFFYWHLLVVGATTYILLGQWSNWQIPVIITASHLLIDTGKGVIKRDNTLVFLTDQFLHLAVIIICWLSLTDQFRQIQFIHTWFEHEKTWLIILGYLLNTMPLGILIAYLTRRWNNELKEGKKASLRHAGRWIGMLERVLVFTFMLSGEMRAIGFLLAAKSVFRFGDLKETKDRKRTEYILIGTLLSFTFSIILSLLIRNYWMT